jgi:hypothetical protein
MNLIFTSFDGFGLVCWLKPGQGPMLRAIVFDLVNARKQMAKDGAELDGWTEVEQVEAHKPDAAESTKQMVNGGTYGFDDDLTT